MFKAAAIAGAAFLLTATAASADPWKDESGHGHDDRRDHYDRDRDRDDRRDWRRDDRDRRWSRAIPRGHLPPPGLCRVWFDDRPAGHQPPPTDCRRARRIANHYGGRLIWGGRR